MEELAKLEGFLWGDADFDPHELYGDRVLYHERILPGGEGGQDLVGRCRNPDCPVKRLAFVSEHDALGMDSSV